jgi:ankyrin repeat protein
MESLDDPQAATDAGTTALMLAAHDPVKVKLLIDRGADVKSRTKTGYDALMVASQYGGNVESVRLLLAHGASPAPRKGVLFNMSALFVASAAGDAGIVKLLLQHGASPKEASILFGFYPYRPMEVATQFQHAEVLRALVQGGAKVDLEDGARMTPLSSAALYHKDTSVATLLELGADPKHKDKYGYTPLDHTPGIRNSSPKAAELLKAALK